MYAAIRGRFRLFRNKFNEAVDCIATTYEFGLSIQIGKTLAVELGEYFYLFWLNGENQTVATFQIDPQGFVEMIDSEKPLPTPSENGGGNRAIELT